MFNVFLIDSAANKWNQNLSHKNVSTGPQLRTYKMKDRHLVSDCLAFILDQRTLIWTNEQLFRPVKNDRNLF